MKHIDSPTFAPWETFTNAQLDGMLMTWRWIRSQPDWAFWHSESAEFIGAIERELQSRSRPSPPDPRLN